MNTSLVSVVVTTRNEERNIENCLRSIRLQTWPNIEVIVVDNQSTDKTKQLAAQFADIVVDKGPERSAQRNHGIAELASGEFAMFLDADMLMTPNVVEKCVSALSSSGAIALHIDEVVLGKGILGVVRRYERSFYSGTVIDGVRFFRREDFIKIGGFDQSLPPGPEDWDLDKKFKKLGKLVLIPNEGNSHQWSLAEEINKRGVRFNPKFVGIYHNEDDQTLRRYLEKKSYYSGSMVAYSSKWQDDPDVAKQLGATYRFLIVFLEKGRWKKVIARPDLFVCMFGLRLLVGVNYLRVKRKSSAVEGNIYR